MNDRFKFRFYDKENKIMVYADTNNELLPYYPDEIYTTWQTYDLSAIEDLADNEDYIVMQCTGLKDKNGKLIYEGDILKQPDGIVDYVYWENGCYLHNGTAITNYDFCYQGDSWAKEVNTHEVIGNIYENKDLLEEQQNDK